MKKRNDIFQELKHYIPAKYWKLVYIHFVLGIKWTFLRSGRGAGKTQFMEILTALKAIAEPNGDILWLRDYQNHNKQTMEGVEKWIIRFSQHFPELRNFNFNKRDYLYTRTLPDGKIQSIHFLGIDNGGVQKIKGYEKNGGYFSALFMDENEELSGIKTDAEAQKDHDEVKQIVKTISRREGIWATLDLPPILICSSSNPKVQNSWIQQLYSKYLPDNKEKLQEDKFDYIIVKNYEGGNGAVFVKTNFLMIVEESMNNPKVNIPESEIKSYVSLKQTNPEEYDNDVLGIEKVPYGAIWQEHMQHFLQDIPNQMVWTTIGVDYGIIDAAVITLVGRRFKTKNGKFDITRDMGVLDQHTIKGLKLEKKQTMTTLEQKNKRKKAISYAILEYINEILEDPDTPPYWITYFKDYGINIVGGNKDYDLLNYMSDIVAGLIGDTEEERQEYRHLEPYLNFKEASKLNAEFDVHNRQAYLKNEIVLNRNFYLNKEITPRIYEYFKTVDLDNYKNHPYLQNEADSFFYAVLTDKRENE